MDINTKAKINKLWRVLWKGAVGVFAVFSIIVALRVLYVAKNTPEQVAKIHATKLTIDDVMGVNLPPDPGTEADKTIAGIDANKNGIRDDVELAIFKEYPNSAKTRAVLLQYALALQMEAMYQFEGKDTVIEIANKQDSAIFCVAKIVPGGGEGSVFTAMQKYSSPIFYEQFNTEKRMAAHKYFYSNIRGGKIETSTSCDLELSLLEN